MFSWDFNTATLLAILVQIVVSVAFVVRADGRSKTAAETAQEAHAMAKEAHEKIAIVQASLSLHREQVAREYIDRDAMREFKDEVMGGLKDLGRRIDEVLKTR